MAARRRPAGRARGGEGIQALRPARARLIPALAATVAAAAVAGYTLGLGGRYGALAAALAAVGLLVLIFGLVRRAHGAVPWAVTLVGAGYVLALGGRDTVDGWAAVVGGALLLTAELAIWSIEHDDRVYEEAAVLQRRIAALAGLVAGALLLGMLVVSAAAFSGATGIVVATAGVAAAVLAVAIVLRLVRTT
ncbi:MAG TPA: hypothetical protein VGJ77_07645 [Gaiellaceae bacterium]